MKIALVHELLTMRGGAERVLRIFADMFPNAPIYTLLYDEKKLGDWFPPERVRTSTVQRSAHMLPIGSRRYDHHLYLKRFPRAVEAWDFSEFDLVLSSSSAFAHGIITNGAPKHICYVHSPARYLWDRYHDVRMRLNPVTRHFFDRTAHRLRIWDSEAADRADVLLVPSREVQRRCELYWRRESSIVPPPIDDHWLQATSYKLQADRRYFLIVSTLAQYKRIDLAIEAANALKVPLKIAGEGPDAKRLRSIAGNTVKFLGYRTHDELKALYANAKATVFPGDEDFGLVPLESMACGTPVIAHKKGGALETVIDGKTGAFFAEPTAVSLAETLRAFDPKAYHSDELRAHAAHFSRSAFALSLRTHIDAVMP